MVSCKYSNETKCKECKYLFFKDCKKFKEAHLAFLTRNIRPFKFEKVKGLEKVVWSRNVNTAKSAATLFAVNKNVEVKSLTASQLLSNKLNNQEFEGKVFYIDYSTKLVGEADKVNAVLKSALEDLIASGALVSIFVSVPSGNFCSEYKHI